MKNFERYCFYAIFLIGVSFPLRAQMAESKMPDYILQEPSGPLEFKKQPFDVLSYSVFLDLTKAPLKEMSGLCEMWVDINNLNSGNNFVFHLRSLTVDSVLYNHKKTTFTSVGEPLSPDFHYKVNYPDSSSFGDFAVFSIYYHGIMTQEYPFSVTNPANAWGGVQSDAGCLYALGVGFANEYVSAARHWMPCYDHPSDKATLNLTIKTAPGKMAVSNGLLKNASDTLYNWYMKDEAATYLMTFAVDNYTPLNFKSIGMDTNLPIVVYSKPQDSSLTRKSFKNLPRMVSSFERLYTQYPFEKVGYCNTPKGAMEHQTMISYPTQLSRSGDTVNSVAAHELAHQWWGDLVTPLDFRHTWLTESFATYSESAWMEELRGRDGFLKSQSDKANYYIKTISKNEGVFPLYDFPRASPSSNYPETIYQKGAVVLGMLRYELGDSLFYGALKSYLQKHAYGNATTDSLLKTLNEYTGRDLTWFFDQWVYGKGWPKVDIAIERAATGFQRVQLRLRQNQNTEYGTYRNLPVEIGFKTASGETIYRVVKMKFGEDIFTLDSIPEFTDVTVNQGPSVRTLLDYTTVITSTDVNDNELPDFTNAMKLEIAPNPATNDATVHFTATGEMKLEVITVTGNVLFADKISGLDGENHYVLKTGNFSPGIYSVKISNSQNSVVKRLSVVR